MQKTFGSLIMDLQGTTLLQDEKELILHPLVGGLILFSRNYETPEQVEALIKQVRQVVQDKPFLIMVDQEGGRVQRFRKDFTRIPPAAVYGQVYDENPALGLQLAETGGWVMAYELLARGVDLSLAPILDLNKGVSSVIGDRAFHGDIIKAIKLAAAYIHGMKVAGMAATGKHFPGHGSVAPDSHKELPVDERRFDELAREDLQPFVHFINAKIPALMTAHILFPAVDKLPVSFSRYWLHEVLRQELHFEGVVMSDDLDMKGADSVGDYADRMQLAREAGCDLILLCNNRAAVLQVLDRVPHAAHSVDLNKYELLRGRFAEVNPRLDENQAWLNRRDFLLKHCELA
jgi:beta-N-acetylhexosaminidase